MMTASTPGLSSTAVARSSAIPSSVALQKNRGIVGTVGTVGKAEAAHNQRFFNEHQKALRIFFCLSCCPISHRFAWNMCYIFADTKYIVIKKKFSYRSKTTLDGVNKQNKVLLRFILNHCINFLGMLGILKIYVGYLPTYQVAHCTLHRFSMMGTVRRSSHPWPRIPWNNEDMLK